ncbi:hypothetical protein [Prescottella equi]|nr:hypothetical protein [Prescottella equi]
MTEALTILGYVATTIGLGVILFGIIAGIGAVIDIALFGQRRKK